MLSLLSDVLKDKYKKFDDYYIEEWAYEKVMNIKKGLDNFPLQKIISTDNEDKPSYICLKLTTKQPEVFMTLGIFIYKDGIIRLMSKNIENTTNFNIDDVNGVIDLEVSADFKGIKKNDDNNEFIKFKTKDINVDD